MLTLCIAHTDVVPQGPAGEGDKEEMHDVDQTTSDDAQGPYGPTDQELRDIVSRALEEDVSTCNASQIQVPY